MSIVMSDTPCLPDISVQAHLVSTDYDAHWIIAFDARNASNELNKCVYATLTGNILQWARVHPQCVFSS